jgi:biopolymer transport protein ExbD
MNFRRRQKPEAIAFQIAPMIDFLIVVLCYTISTQILTAWEAEVDVTLPTAQTAQVEQRLPGEIILNVLKDGAVIVNGRQLSDEDLSALLGRLVALFPGQPVLLRADKQTPYQHIIRVLDLCRRTDIWNVSFAAMPTEKK